MYNEEYKRKYLNYLTETNKYDKGSEIIGTYFNLSETLEATLDKDVSNFTLEEIVSLYKSICTTSELYLASINSQLSQYCEWNRRQGLSIDNQNHFEEMTRELIYGCTNKNLFKSRYMSKSELLRYINRGILDNVSDEFLLVACFEGVCGTGYCELLNLYPQDIQGNTVTLCTGRQLVVSDLFIRLANESAEEYEYNIGKIVYFDRDDHRCFKMFRKNISDENRKLVIVRRFKKLKDSHGCEALGSKNLMESGRLDMIKNYMKENDCDFFKAMKDEKFKEAMEYRYGALQSIASYYRNFKELLEDVGRN